MVRYVDNPIVIGCSGGSGSRVVAAILKEAGVYIGNNLNRAYDTLDLTFFSWFGLGKHAIYWTDPMDDLLFQSIVGELQLGLERHLSGYSLNEMRYWGWKKPDSMYFLPFLYEQFPNMKFIHLIRDGRDMACSKNQNQLKHFGPYLLAENVMNRSQMESSISLWNLINLKVVDFAQSAMRGQYLQLRYEDICLEPIRTINKLFEFCQLDQDSRCFIGLVEHKEHRIGKWHHLTNYEINRLTEFATGGLIRFGYL